MGIHVDGLDLVREGLNLILEGLGKPSHVDEPAVSRPKLDMLGRLRAAVNTEGELFVLCAFYCASAEPMVRTKTGSICLATSQIAALVERIAPTNRRAALTGRAIGGCLTGFTQRGQLRTLGILRRGNYESKPCMGKRKDRLWYLDAEWLDAILALAREHELTLEHVSS